MPVKFTICKKYAGRVLVRTFLYFLAPKDELLPAVCSGSILWNCRIRSGGMEFDLHGATFVHCFDVSPIDARNNVP